MVREILEGDGWEFPAIVYKPEKIEGELPLIIQIHGAGEVGDGGEELIKVERHGFSNLLKTGKDYPCILVMPQCPKVSLWAAEIPNFYRYIKQLIDAYPVDIQRICLTGLSMGGYGTWFIAMRHPHIFAAIAPICGGGMPWRADAIDMPVWAWHGSEDEAVFPSASMEMIHEIRKTGINKGDVRLTIVDGVAHDVWDYAYQDELMQWLLAQERKDAYV